MKIAEINSPPGRNYVASWRPDMKRLYKDTDAQKVADEILSLGAKVNPEEIVNMARDENTESHKLFEWDNTVAAEKYRIHQARNVYNNLEITEIGLNKGEKPQKIGVPLRMFYNLRGESGYRPTVMIMESEDLTQKLLRTARLELESYMNKYSSLTSLAPLFEYIRNNFPPAA